MLDDLYSGLNVSIRAHETNLLLEEHYERMLNADSFDDAVNVLRETPYRKYIEEIQEQYNYDYILSQELERAYELVDEDSQDPKIVEFAALRYAYHNLKVLFKEEYTERELDHLYINIGRYSIPELRQAVRTGTSSILDQRYLYAINLVRDDYEEYESMYSIDIILDNAYFGHYVDLAKEFDDLDIERYAKMFADYSNISFLIRAMKQERTPNFVDSILNDAGELDKEELVELSRGNIANVTRTLSESPYQHIIEEATDNSTGELNSVKFDQLKDDELMEEMKSAKIKAFGPFPSIAYLHAKEIEVMNIRLILAGKENSIDTSQVRERMRMNYVA